jgi:adenosine kinase
MNILITGSVAYDYLMTFPGHFQECFLPEQLSSISLSFLVDSMKKVRGGIASNIAYTMALLGLQPKIMATVGEDFQEYRAWLEAHRIDTSQMVVIDNEFTSSFFVTTDKDSSQIASFYPGAMGYAHTQTLKTLSGLPELVVISPTDPRAMKKFTQEARELSIPFVYDPSQQVARLSGEELIQDLTGARFLFCNWYEYELIQKKTGLSPAELLHKVGALVITKGKEGAVVIDSNGELTIPTVQELTVQDPTGVGDAFRGGFLTGYLWGSDYQECGRVGSLAAVYCLEKQGPQGHRYERSEFVDRFKVAFPDKAVPEFLITRTC